MTQEEINKEVKRLKKLTDEHNRNAEMLMAAAIRLDIEQEKLDKELKRKTLSN